MPSRWYVRPFTHLATAFFPQLEAFGIRAECLEGIMTRNVQKIFTSG